MSVKAVKLTEEERRHYLAWTHSLDTPVRALVEQYPLDELFRFNVTGTRVIVTGICPRGVSLKISVLPQFNPLRLCTGMEITGVDPDLLEPLPDSEMAVIKNEAVDAVYLRDALSAARISMKHRLEQHIDRAQYVKGPVMPS